jgi:hypothetical protein
LSAKIRMQPASIRARACRSRFCLDVDPRAYLISAPARFAGLGGERVVLIGDGEAGRASTTPQPDGKRQCRSCQALRLLNTFSGIRQQLKIKVGAGFRSRVHGCPKPSAAPGSC